MMNKTILMLSVSCMPFIAGADLCYAGFNPDDTPLSLSPALLKSHVSTHTSHLTAGHLSSLEDFNKDDLFVTLTRSLRSDLSPQGRGGNGAISYSGLTGENRSDKATASFHLDPRIKSEDDTLLFLPSPSRGEGQGESDNIAFKPSLTLPNYLGREKKEEVKLAAACFVTDTTDCSGNEFAGNNADDDSGGVPPGGGDDYELDDEDRCRREGYTETSCPEGYEPYNYCPYDNTYFQKCVSSCPSDYKECEEPYHGVGEACDGKYASCECTPCGAGYDYTTIPEGYVQDGEACLDCDGKTKYKIKPNPCDGYMDCGNMGPEIGAGTCQSGNETLYDNCKACPYECSLSSCPEPFTCTKEECSGMYCKSGCQSGYDWDAVIQVCTCEAKYKYTCSGTGYIGGSGLSCDGKYASCNCADGYEWNGGICEEVIVPEDKGCTANCQIGDIFFSDGSCGTEKVSGKTPIGVVVYKYKSVDREVCWAMALETIGTYQWGDYGDIGDLPGYGSASAASGDFDSCGNTDKIRSAGNNLHYPAAWAASGYSAGGMNGWCLPAAGIMYSINNNMSAVNAGFLRAGGVQLGSNSFLWTSTEYTADLGAWRSFFDGTYGLTNYPKKDKEYDVRPVIEF